MELIKQIRQAEQQAGDIVNKSEADAAASVRQMRADVSEALAAAERDGVKAVEAAEAEGVRKGQAMADDLAAEALEQRKELRSKAQARIDAAVSKVLSYLGA